MTKEMRVRQERLELPGPMAQPEQQEKGEVAVDQPEQPEQQEVAVPPDPPDQLGLAEL